MILNRGRLVASDRPDRLTGMLTGPRPVVARVRMDFRPDLAAHSGQCEPEAPEGTWRIEGNWTEEEGRAVMARIVEQGGTVLEWRSVGSGLEEIFRSLTLDKAER